MAIANANISWFGNGPTETGQIVIEGGDTGKRKLFGKVTFTGDGSASSAQLNFIDGTKTLPFTPGGALIFRSGGDATATVTATELEITDAAKGTVTFSAAPGNTNTVILTVMLHE